MGDAWSKTCLDAIGDGCASLLINVWALIGIGFLSGLAVGFVAADFRARIVIQTDNAMVASDATTWSVMPYASGGVPSLSPMGLEWLELE